MIRLEHGSLENRPGLPWIIEGVEFREMSTSRREEYHKLADIARKLPDSTKTLDVACGSEADVHAALAIMKTLGFFVVGLDHKSGIANILADMTRMPFLDESFDFVYCISVLEHLDKNDQRKSVDEIDRVLAPSGLLFLTADHPVNSQHLCGFFPNYDHGNRMPPPVQHTSPPVDYLIARKPKAT